MKFKREDLQDLLWGEAEYLEIVEDTIVETTRWSVVSNLIFRYNGKFYQTLYSTGATEQQDERPFENDPNMIECQEVKPKEVRRIEYVSV